MKYVDEYRDPALAKKISQQIKSITTKQHVIMEVCGGQTHSIVKYGINELLPTEVELVHGPGCPVCVTPLELIDKAITIAQEKEVIFTSFGDMMRVPGSKTDMLSVKAQGSDVRMVYSPLDALKIARENPENQVVFFAVGFETTAPGNALAVYQARQNNINNFSVLVSHVLVPPAIEAIMSSPNNRVRGFLAAGHVCTIMGLHQYEPLAQKYKVPIVAAGFEPLDILEGIYLCVKQLEEGRNEVENSYARSVRSEGNQNAQEIMNKVFSVCEQKWRGIGKIPQSGLMLAEEYETFDAEKRFGLVDMKVEESADCLSGIILQGLKKPSECPAFGNKCTPEHPLGATMVSSEGACAAYYRYRK